MKHLKIYFAVLFFSFLGAANVGLTAQQDNKLKASSSHVSLADHEFKLQSFAGDYTYTLIIIYSGMRIYKDNGIHPSFSLLFPEHAGSVQVLDNGNFVAYNKDGKIIWETGTAGRGGAKTHLQIQSDGNLVLYNGSWTGGDGDALWATGTCGGVKNGCGVTGPR